MNTNVKGQDKKLVERINIINEFQVEYGDEDFTLMCPLQHLISQNYLEENSKKVEIVGYSKQHPSIDSIILRVQFEDQKYQTAENVLYKTMESCDLLMNICSDMLEKLKILKI